MNSYFPSWVADVASIMSIVGFVVTCFLLLEARKIRQSFIRKVRIPEIVSELDSISSELIAALKSYKSENRSAHEKIQKASALMESILPKISANSSDRVQLFIKSSKTSLNGTLDEDVCWRLYGELSGVVTYLQQISKDTKWD